MTTSLPSGWPLDQTPARYVLGHVRAVVADRILDDARIVVDDGVITAVEAHPAGGASDVDGGGLLCLPGLVDVHSDALERERRPRPGAEVPLEFAFASLEAKLLAAGVTTVFHGVAFQDSGAGSGAGRTVDQATEVAAFVDALAGSSSRLDHRILHRLDLRSEHGGRVLRQRLDAAIAAGTVPLVSHEDHTPGQGQYTDRGHYEAWYVDQEGLTPDEARLAVDRLIAAAAGTDALAADGKRWLGELARERRIRLVGHDPDTTQAVDELVDRGGIGAEFPTTVVAAQRARERGLSITVGAPNALRGSSHNGNVSAGELVALGLADVLASDYLPSALLGAAFALVERGVLALPAAVALVTSGPARAAGLTDRGELAVGRRADLVVVDDGGAWPRVAATLTAGFSGGVAQSGYNAVPEK